MLVDLDELPGAAVLYVADIDVIAEEQQERLVADELAGLVHRVAKAFRRRLLGKREALAERGQFLGFQDRPVLPGERLHHVIVEPAEIVAVGGFFPGRGDNADLLDTGIDGFFADNLNHRLGETIAIDQREHFLLHRGGSRVLPGSTPRGGDDGLSYFCHKMRSQHSCSNHFALPRLSISLSHLIGLSATLPVPPTFTTAPILPILLKVGRSASATRLTKIQARWKIRPVAKMHRCSNAFKRLVWLYRRLVQRMRPGAHRRTGDARARVHARPCRDASAPRLDERFAGRFGNTRQHHDVGRDAKSRRGNEPGGQLGRRLGAGGRRRSARPAL